MKWSPLIPNESKCLIICHFVSVTNYLIVSVSVSRKVDSILVMDEIFRFLRATAGGGSIIEHGNDDSTATASKKQFCRTTSECIQQQQAAN